MFLSSSTSKFFHFRMFYNIMMYHFRTKYNEISNFPQILSIYFNQFFFTLICISLFTIYFLKSYYDILSEKFMDGKSKFCKLIFPRNEMEPQNWILLFQKSKFILIYKYLSLLFLLSNIWRKYNFIFIFFSGWTQNMPQ